MWNVTSAPVFVCTWRRTNSGMSTWYSNGPTWSRASSSSTRLRVPVILVIIDSGPRSSLVPDESTQIDAPRRVALERGFPIDTVAQVVTTTGDRQRVGHVVRLRH